MDFVRLERMGLGKNKESKSTHNQSPEETFSKLSRWEFGRVQGVKRGRFQLAYLSSKPHTF